MKEHHKGHRIGWLRASVLGANDGILSTASLIVGVVAAHASRADVVLTATAGLVAGAMSMAAGEYVSVSSQADTEQADLVLERDELAKNLPAETRELANIYVCRGLDSVLAMKVAKQLMAHDAIGAHARDELGTSENTVARPVLAALSSAGSFSAGAVLPLVLIFLVPEKILAYGVSSGSLVFLALLGAMAAWAGGADIWKGTLRVTFWGALAMGVTAGIGVIFGKAS